MKLCAHQLYSVLSTLEWWGYSERDEESYCPSCFALRKVGHDPNCGLYRALERYRELVDE